MMYYKRYFNVRSFPWNDEAIPVVKEIYDEVGANALQKYIEFVYDGCNPPTEESINDLIVHETERVFMDLGMLFPEGDEDA